MRVHPLTKVICKITDDLQFIDELGQGIKSLIKKTFYIVVWEIMMSLEKTREVLFFTPDKDRYLTITNKGKEKKKK